MKDRHEKNILQVTVSVSWHALEVYKISLRISIHFWKKKKRFSEGLQKSRISVKYSSYGKDVRLEPTFCYVFLTGLLLLLARESQFWYSAWEKKYSELQHYSCHTKLLFIIVNCDLTLLCPIKRIWWFAKCATITDVFLINSFMVTVPILHYLKTSESQKENFDFWCFWKI